MREPAPPYAGEGPHALWHVSEDATLGRFEPRDGLVWAVDTRHLPLYWFPRACPRATFWAGADTTGADVDRFLGGDRARRAHAIRGDWLAAVRAAEVVAYRLPDGPFVEREDAGFWTATTPVEALELVPLGDLLARHAEAGIELRVVPDLARLWERVIASSLAFSGIRLRNL